MSEERLWLEEALAGSSDTSPARARALGGNAVLAHYQGDYDRAEQLSLDALERFRMLEDGRGIAEASTGLALVQRTRGDYPGAEALFCEALAVYEGLGDEEGTARALDRLAMCLVVAGEMARARPLFQRSLDLFRGLGDSHGVALGLYGLAATRPPGGEVTALSHAGECLEILRTVGDRRSYSKALWTGADINADLGNFDKAAAEFQESLTLFVEFGDRWFDGIVLESAGFLAAATGDAARAVHLLAAAAAIRTAPGVPLWVGFRKRHEHVLAETRSRLGEPRFAASPARRPPKSSPENDAAGSSDHAAAYPIAGG